MELQEGNNARDGERMPHHISSADGDPSSSKRPAAGRSSSLDLRLRSLPVLPRSSRNGTASLPDPPAEDFITSFARASASLIAPAPSSFGRGPASQDIAGPRARRSSIAEFLGIRSVNTSRATTLQGSDSVPLPSREITMQGSREITAQGMSAGPLPAQPPGRSRRGSFLQSLGFGSSVHAHEHVKSAPDPLDTATELAALGARSKSTSAASQGRRRRASMLDLFRHAPRLTDLGRVDAPDTSAEAGENGLPLQKSSTKSRRASVMDFFRSSNTGMMVEETADSMSLARGRSVRSEGPTSSRSQRRRSVIDILGHSSKKVLAKLMHHDFDGQLDDAMDGYEGRLWFTSLADFKPLTFKYLSGRYSSAFFACSVRTGRHYILKQFEKEKMSLEDERGVRRSLMLVQTLEHEHIVQCCGTWEDEQALYIVEEYATKGDLLQGSMSHPEKYTEAFMATKVVKPLLEVLVYLHGINIVHRSIFPECVMFGREDKFKLGNFTSAVDQRLDPPNERIRFLDYMAPEMLSVRVNDYKIPAPSPRVVATQPPIRSKTLNSLPSRVGHMPANSIDGTLTSPERAVWGFNQRPASPVSPQTPGAPSSQPSVHDGRSPPQCTAHPVSGLRALTRWPVSVSGGQLSVDPSLSPNTEHLPSDKSTSSRPSGQPSNLGGSRRPRGGGGDACAMDAPWLTPTDVGRWSAGSGTGNSGQGSTLWRRKSAVEEMNAPWLKPLDPGQSGDEGDPSADWTGGGQQLPEAKTATAPGAHEMLGLYGLTGMETIIAANVRGDAADGEENMQKSDKPDSSVTSLKSVVRLSQEGCCSPDAAVAVAVLPPQSEPTSPRTTCRPLTPPSGPAESGSLVGSEPPSMESEAPLPSRTQSMSYQRVASTRRSLGAACHSVPPMDLCPLERIRQMSQLDGPDCLPGYAGERSPPPPPASVPPYINSPLPPASPLPHHPPIRPPSTLHTQVSRRHPDGADTGTAGPVAESLGLSTESNMLIDGAANTQLEIKRACTGLSFTAVTSTANGGDGGSEDASTRPQRLASRAVSRETSASTVGAVGLQGLKTMARNITARLGQVLGARSGDLSGVVNPESSAGEVTDGGGGAGGVGWTEEATPPRQSYPGGGAGADAATVFVPQNPWEWQEHYNEKVDVWQVGCLVHEILCLSLPFEAEDKLLVCALIMWADITSFPDNLSPECHDFIRVCLTKNPAERPCAAELLQHPWIARHAAGEILKSVRQQREDDASVTVSGSKELTTVQRTMTGLGLGWLVGAGGGEENRNGGAGGAGTGSGRRGWSAWFAWLPRPWTAKVAPGSGSEKDGDAKFEMAMAMVQEHIARRSLDVEAGARRQSLESQRPTRGTPETPIRWAAVL